MKWPNWFIKSHDNVEKKEGLKQFFVDHKCPVCRNDKFTQWQDGGHDICLTCSKCYTSFGIQEAPFEMIEKLDYGNPLK
jgi:hypothetical protein